MVRFPTAVIQQSVVGTTFTNRLWDERSGSAARSLRAGVRKSSLVPHDEKFMADRHRVRIEDLQDKIRRVLMDEWDPIGVKDIPEAADEYDCYIGEIYGLIQRGASAGEISEHLRRLEIRNMEIA